MGDIVGGGVAGTQKVATPSRTASLDFTHRQFGNIQRQEAHRAHALVVVAEISDAAIVGAGAAVQGVGVKDRLHTQVAPELLHRHPGEHQLAVVSQQVERALAFVGIVTAQRVPALAVQDVGFRARHRRRVMLAPLDYRRNRGDQVFGCFAARHREVDRR